MGFERPLRPQKVQIEAIAHLEAGMKPSEESHTDDVMLWAAGCPADVSDRYDLMRAGFERHTLHSSSSSLMTIGADIVLSVENDSNQTIRRELRLHNSEI